MFLGVQEGRRAARESCVGSDQEFVPINTFHGYLLKRGMIGKGEGHLDLDKVFVSSDFFYGYLLERERLGGEGGLDAWLQDPICRERYLVAVERVEGEKAFKG